MKKSTLIAIIALLISLIGVLVALVAYFKRRRCLLCEDMADGLYEDEYFGLDDLEDTTESDMLTKTPTEAELTTAENEIDLDEMS